MRTVSIPPLQIGRILRDPLQFLLQTSQQHGDHVRFDIPLTSIHYINHPDGIRHVLQGNNTNYSKNTIQFNTLSLITGNGLLTSDGAHWLQQRRLMQPAFHRRRIAAHGATISSVTSNMLTGWRDGPDVVDIDEAMMKLTLETVGRILFNVDLAADAGSIVHAVLEVLDYVVYRASTPLALPPAVPTPINRRYQRALALLDHYVYTLIATRRRDGTDYGDVLSLLLTAQDADSGARMSDRQLRDEVLTLLIAGHETVASALTWTWYLLSKHPAVRTQLEAELEHVLGERPPSTEDLANLPFTAAVFAETLRLYPPAWLITRRTLAADEILGSAIAAESLIILSPYTVHRHADFWPNPEGFDPQRHMGDAARGRHRFAYIPFGGGPRLCIGDQLARLEACLIIATVAQRWHLDMLPGQWEQPRPLVTLRPRHWLHMRLCGR